jgi:alkanesulfonate monooxygenase SsuD/methylene tetrahydromethanopterin reductase-like flavin-dependent oxidoreductase (luciferase family)
VKLGLILPLFSGDPDLVLAAAVEAEELGFDGVFVFDHLFPLRGRPDGPALEPFTTLARVAAATSRVAVGTLVTRALLRPPGLLAKTAATLDLIAPGRFILGVGTGDASNHEEHRRYGFPAPASHVRRAHLAETVTALRTLFRGEAYAGGALVPRLEGPLVPPVHNGGPRLWVGGTSEELVRVAATQADGWNGWSLTPEAFRTSRELLDADAALAGRTVEATWAGLVLAGRDDREVSELMEDRRRRGLGERVAWTGPAADLRSHLRRLADAGATWAILMLAGPGGRRRLVAQHVID